LLFSIPIIIWGSRFVLTLMDRFPAVILFGAGLLGWIGGGMIADDVLLAPYVKDLAISAHYSSAVIGAMFVAALGKWLASRAPKPAELAAGVTELAAPPRSTDKENSP